MRSTIFICTLMFANLVWANEPGLPREPDLTKVALGQIAKDNNLQLDFHLTIPASHKLNQGAPSFIGVYEKIKDQPWHEVQRFDLNDFLLTLGAEVSFSKKIQLQAKDSQVAVHATVYHCGKAKKSMCYIQGFQGITTRSQSPQASNKIPFTITGRNE